MWQAASSYAAELESLRSAPPQSAGWDPFIQRSHSHHGHPPVLSLSLIWTIRAKTGEASFLCTQPTSCPSVAVVPLSNVFLHLPPLTHRQAVWWRVDVEVSSTLWLCLRTLSMLPVSGSSLHLSLSLPHPILFTAAHRGAVATDWILSSSTLTLFLCLSGKRLFGKVCCLYCSFECSHTRSTYVSLNPQSFVWDWGYEQLGNVTFVIMHKYHLEKFDFGLNKWGPGAVVAV